MTAAPAPARLRAPVIPVIPDDASSRAAGPGAAAPGECLRIGLDVLRGRLDARTRLQHGVGLLPLLVGGCDHASATIPARRGTRVGAATDGVASRADALQDEVEEGPGLQALRTGHGVLSHDLEVEDRWPHWCHRVGAELGLGAAMSVLLSVDQQPLGTLTLYGDAGRLSDVDLGLLHTLAGPLASALAAVRAGR